MLTSGDPGASDDHCSASPLTPGKGSPGVYLSPTFPLESEKYQLPFVISLAEVCMLYKSQQVPKLRGAW